MAASEREIGVGAVAAVLLDAFLVRTLLVPSLMGMLGRYSWYSPRVLRRLHQRAAVREAPLEDARAAVGQPAPG